MWLQDPQLGTRSLFTAQRFGGPLPRDCRGALLGVPHEEGQRRPLVLSGGTDAPWRDPKQYVLDAQYPEKSCCHWRRQWLEEGE